MLRGAMFSLSAGLVGVEGCVDVEAVEAVGVGVGKGRRHVNRERKGGDQFLLLLQVYC